MWDHYGQGCLVFFSKTELGKAWVYKRTQK